jgi:hypothetical protein
MKPENNELKEIDETSRELSNLREEIKPKIEKISNKKEKEKDKSKNSNLLFKNDINILKPKYYGRTKSLLFIGQTPIFILGESSKNYLFININIYLYSFICLISYVLFIIRSSFIFINSLYYI